MLSVPISFFALIFSAVFLHLPVPHLLNHAELTVGHAGSEQGQLFAEETVKAKGNDCWNQTEGTGKTQLCPKYIVEQTI